MMQYLIAPNGRFVTQLTGTAQEILANVPGDHTLTMTPPPRTTDYWNGTSWVAIGAAPKYFMEFNYDLKEWVDTRNVVVARTEKWNQIKLQRNQLEFGGFTWDDKPFDSDQVSQGRILAAIVFGMPTTWTLSNDEVIELSAQDIADLGAAMAQHIQSAHARGRAARIAINEAQTPAEVDAVLF